HERRNLFPGTRIMDPGATEDGRFLNVEVAGAHSNIGGSYRLDGLSARSGNLMGDHLNALRSAPFLDKREVRPEPQRHVLHRREGRCARSGNLMVDYLNALSSEPFLDKREVGPDPERDVIHRSEDHQFFYRTSVFDRQGERAHQEELAPAVLCPIDCRDALPRNDAMAARLEWRQVEIGPMPGGAQQVVGPAAPEAPAQAAWSPEGRDAHARLDRLLTGQIDPATQQAWDREVADRASELARAAQYAPPQSPPPA